MVSSPKPAAGRDFEAELAHFLNSHYDSSGLLVLYGRVAWGDGPYDALMRRAIWRAQAGGFGQGISIGSGVVFEHLETVEIGDDVYIGAQSYLLGGFDGRCIICDHVWIGPQSYFEARNLYIGEGVDWGAGAKVLDATHGRLPEQGPLFQTHCSREPVVVQDWAEIGANAILMPGVTVGHHSQVTAGSLVTEDVPAFALVSGVPAQLVGWKNKSEPRTGLR